MVGVRVGDSIGTGLVDIIVGIIVCGLVTGFPVELTVWARWFHR